MAGARCLDRQNDKNAMHSYFGSNFENYQLINVRLAGAGEGSSAKAIYVNPNSKVKEFQVGEYFYSTIFLSLSLSLTLLTWFPFTTL